jgi:hypothetical protein
MRKIILSLFLILSFASLSFSADVAKINDLLADPSGTNNVDKINGTTWGTTAGNIGSANGLTCAAAAGCTPSTPTVDNSEIGYVNVGGGNAPASDGRLYCLLATADCSGTLGTAYIYGSGATGALKALLFSTTDTSGTPTNGTLISSTAEIGFAAGAGWSSAATTGGSVTATTKYWLCYHVRVAPALYYTTGVGRYSVDLTDPYATPPNKIPVAADCTASTVPYSCCSGAGTGCTWAGPTADRKMSFFVGIQ